VEQGSDLEKGQAAIKKETHLEQKYPAIISNYKPPHLRDNKPKVGISPNAPRTGV
jgi:hypothetical protein